MAKNADLLICDSVNIERYMRKEYKRYNPNTTFIAYGSNIQINSEDNDNAEKELENWYNEYSIIKNEYYLIVGRFVQENNYKTMIK